VGRAGVGGLVGAPAWGCWLLLGGRQGFSASSAVWEEPAPQGQDRPARRKTYAQLFRVPVLRGAGPWSGLTDSAVGGIMIRSVREAGNICHLWTSEQELT